MKKSSIFIGLIALCLCVAFSGNVSAKADTVNLLINGGGEDGMNGWTDVDGCWYPDTYDTSHKAVEGETFFWPSKKTTEFTQIFQDVDITSFDAGMNLELGAYLANYDQSPHDQATLQLDILDAYGNVLASDFSIQRNPEWCYNEVNVAIPENAVTARVYLIAKRFVGLDDDAYFDAVSLKCTDIICNPVVITGDTDRAVPGDTVQLSASDGKYKKASYYEWYTSYNEIASVDENGLVTFVTDVDSELENAELVVYARNKKTDVIGKYLFNSELIVPVYENDTQADNGQSGENTGDNGTGNTAGDNGSAGTGNNAGDTEPKNGETVQNTDKGKLEPVEVFGAVAVKLTWKKAKNVTGYEIYKYNEATGKYKKIKTIKKAGTTSYTATGLKMGNTYKFKIRSYKTKNGKKTYSDYSSVVKVDLRNE